MNYIETIDVVKQYASHLALNKVSISVPEKSIYGLLGPNGAGKTTLIRIINHITAPDSGQVLIKGNESSARDVRLIGYLPEERGLYKKMKVGEHAIFLAQLKGLSKTEAKDRIYKWFDKLDIMSWKDKKVEELSKGMQQKVQFITTVVHDPELLILDEPFSGFDPVNAEILTNEILELRDKGKTIILSTHNMESVETLCNNISLINKSQVVLQGDVAEVKQRFKENIFEFKISDKSFNLESSLFSLLSEKEEADNLTIRVHKEGATSNSELIQAVSAQHEILSFKEVLPTMNDIFIQTVKG